jgi:hypothetical protein
MQFPIARLPDSLILSKLAAVGNNLAKANWVLTVTGQHHQLFTVTVAAGGKTPWAGNQTAEKMAISTGMSGRTFLLNADGRHIVQINRQDNDSFDRITTDQNWFSNDPAGQLLFVESNAAVSTEFGLTGPAGPLPRGLSDELGRFVETRDQGLARLEELYSRFTQNVLEERERLASELQAKASALENETELKRTHLDEQFAAKEAAFAKRESELAERLKQIDDRGAKHARRALRDTIITELTKRETTFTLTKGTNQLRTPITVTLLIAGFLFAVGLVQNALIAPEILATGLASVLLGSASEARLNIGGNKLNFSRSGAKELSKKLSE